MLKFYRFSIWLLLCLVANAAHAVSITSTRSQYEPDGVRYFFTVSDWDGSETMCTTSGNDCTIMIVGARAPGNSSSWFSTPYFYPGLRTSPWSWSILEQMVAKGFSMPFKGSFVVPHGSNVSDSLCVSFAYAVRQGGMGAVFDLYGPCARVTKPPLQCEFIGKTTIDHGNVNDTNIDGSAAEIMLQLKCSGVSSVIAKLASTVDLRADHSLYSKLSIGGKNAAGGVNIYTENGSSAPVSIKSTLFSNGAVEPGAFSGSTVLTITPP